MKIGDPALRLKLPVDLGGLTGCGDQLIRGGNQACTGQYEKRHSQEHICAAVAR